MERVKLGDLCVAQSSSLMQKNLEEDSGIYPIYGASGLIKNVSTYKQQKPYIAIVKDGAGVGRVMRLPAKSSIIGTLQYIVPNDYANNDFLYYFLVSKKLGKYCSGATIPHIYFKDYKNIELPLYSLIAQRKIVAELDTILEVIAKKKEQLKKLDLLVKSQFIEMFGDPTQKSKWIFKRLSELGELNRGISKHRPRNAPELLGGEYPLIQTGDVSGADLFIKKYYSTYSYLGLAQSRLWKAGTLCITIAANIAQTAILDFNACFPDSVVGFVPNDKTNLIFIHFWFSFFQKILEDQAPQVAQKNINLQILRELAVIVPPIALQNQFADFVTQTEKMKEQIKTSLLEAENCYNSLMQKYFD